MRKTNKTGMYIGLLTAMLMLGGCGQKTEAVKPMEAKPEMIATTAAEHETEPVKPETEEVQAEESETEIEETEAGNEETEAAEAQAGNEAADAAEDEPETAGAETTESGAPVLSDLYRQIEQKVALNAPMLVSDDFIANYYGMDLSVSEDYFFEMSEAAISAEMVVLIRMKDGADPAAVKAALKEVVDSKATEMENYLPDQFALVKQGEIKTKDQYVYLVISEHAEEITQIIEAAI